MEKITVTLCANCEHCPSVEISDEGVSIGEDQNTVRLSHTEWNDLVSRIRTGGEVPARLNPPSTICRSPIGRRERYGWSLDDPKDEFLLVYRRC